MKVNKKSLEKVLLKLEQYYSNINEPKPSDGAESEVDVPNVLDDKEFKTSLPLEDIEIQEPIVKTKKGKNVLGDPVKPDDAGIKDIEVFDKSGNEINDLEVDDIHDLDKSEPEETVNDLDDVSEECETPGNKIRSKKQGKGKGRGKGKGPIGLPNNENRIFEQDEKEDEDENEMGKIAQDNMGEQNPASGEDPNIDPNTEKPDPNAMMGGDQDFDIGGEKPDATGMMGGQQDPNAMMGGDMGALGGMEPPALSAEQVGKVFELKKIYTRLLSIESQLSFSSDIILLKLRKFISKAIELFETVISNIESYRKEIDDIIIIYYEFLKEVYSIMKRYYKIKEREDKKK